jgi:hypothetical protein
MNQHAGVTDAPPDASTSPAGPDLATGLAPSGWTRWLMLLTVLPIGALGLLGGPAMAVALVVSVAWFVVSSVLLGRQPPRQIPLLSRVCVICGRPLTNGESMRARVGSTCIKRYGPRYAHQVNPDHAVWTLEMVRARADQAERQAHFNVEFDRATAAYPGLLAAWEAERASESGRLRWDARRRATPMFVSSIAACFALVVATRHFA